jgi:hypothetical protein
MGAVGSVAIAHNQDAVIEGSSAFSIKHAAAIQLEGTLRERMGGERS